MKLINLTPHKVVLMDRTGGTLMTLPVSEPVRIDEEISKTPMELEVEGVKIPIYRTEYNKPALPKIEAGCIYIVSRLVRDAIERHYPFISHYFVVPTNIVRNTDGIVVGCKAFSL